MNIYLRIILSLIFINILYSKGNIVVTNGLTHHYKTEKGQVYKGVIELHNTGKDSKNVKVYLQDVSYKSDGTTIYSEPGTNRLTNTNWLELNSNLIELKSGEKSELKFEIKVPDYISEPGSYSSILMIEPIETLPQNTNQKKGIQILSVIRYAVQIITDYSTQNTKTDLKFESINIDNTNKEKLLKIALENKGNIFCRTTIYLEIYSIESSAKIEGDFKSQSMGLLPNTSKSFPINISMLPLGKYKAIAFAKDEQDNIFALEFELDVE